MDNKKFVKYFKNSFIKEAVGGIDTPAVEPEMDDSAAFAGSFEDEGVAGQIDNEVEQATLPPEQRADLLKKADKYAENISKIILPTLRKLHDDIVSGVFASIAPDVKGISGINEDLAKLSEALRGRTRDAVLKANKNEDQKA